MKQASTLLCSLFLFLLAFPPQILADQVPDDSPQSHAKGLEPDPAHILTARGKRSPDLPSRPGSFSFVEWLEESNETTLSLETDMDQLKKERFRQDYQPARIAVQNGAAHFEQEGEVRPRGNYRCRHCRIPPVKVKIPKKKMVEAGFEEWNEFKLVFPCRKGKLFEQYVLKEYLGYRLYNILTDRSFRVRHLNLRLEDARGNNSYFTKAAFLIEHTEEAEDRLGGKEVERDDFHPDSFSRVDYTRMQVFHYMIGNTDWLPVTAQNMKVIRLADGSLVPIPYDFDFSGLVRADYAVPNPHTGLRRVWSRFFMGNNKTEAELEKIFDEFRDKKRVLFNTIAHFAPLDYRERKRMIRYLQGFYKTIDNPKSVRREFLDRPPFMLPMY